VLHDGPPYANGNLHMGSRFCISVMWPECDNYLTRTCFEQNFERYHQPIPRLSWPESAVRSFENFGFSNQFSISDVSYIPGWDCHGLPIENKALQELGVRARSIFLYSRVKLCTKRKTLFP